MDDRRGTRTAEVRGVRVHAVELRRALYDREFLRRERWQTVAKHLLHIRRVMSEVDGVLRERASDALSGELLPLCATPSSRAEGGGEEAMIVAGDEGGEKGGGERRSIAQGSEVRTANQPDKKRSRYQHACQNGPPIQIGHPGPRRTDGNIQRVLRGGDICNAKKAKTGVA